MSNEVIERGKKKIEKILGEGAGPVLNKLRESSEDFVDLIIQHGYGEIYSREHFSDKTKELIAVSALISQGDSGVALQSHLRGMMNVGWTKQDIAELIIFLTGFVGFPKAVGAMKSLGEL